MTGPIAARIVRADEVRVGDSIVLPALGPREVTEIQTYEELTGREPGPRITLVYRVVGGGSSYENKATAHGVASWPQVEGSVSALKPAQPVAIERELDADELGE